MMQHYCLGYAFDSDFNVVLIEKLRPEWMKGKLNGVGGKIESHELPIQAMVREFKEETGMDTTNSDWAALDIITDGENYHITCYYGLFDKLDVKTTTDEQVFVYSVQNLRLYYGHPEWFIEPECPWLIEKAVRNIPKGK